MYRTGFARDNSVRGFRTSRLEDPKSAGGGKSATETPTGSANEPSDEMPRAVMDMRNARRLQRRSGTALGCEGCS